MAETIHTVPVTHLRESPFNPRKSFSEAALQELSLSIASQGVMQPIVARTLPEGQQDIWVRHEIVFGHRRFRAAKLAGLAEVPVILRPMTDEQAAVAQVHENVQRQDVTALEEADSYARLHRQHSMSADAIAIAVGKSRSHVYGRIKLAKVAPEVRAAVADDGLPPDIAIEIARHPDHTLQRKALKDLLKYSDEWPSVRDATRQLRGMFDNNVCDSLFDPNDATLAKLAGPCTTCPKRAGNDPDLQDVVDPGVCTDRSCFEGKIREHNRLEMVVLGAQGHPVIQGPKAEQMLPNRHAQPTGYQSLQSGQWVGAKHVRYAEMLTGLAERGETVPKTTLITVANGQEIKSFLTDEQADAVYKAFSGDDSDDDEQPSVGTSTPSTAARAQYMGGSATVQRERDMADWSPAERLAADDEAWLAVRRAALAELAARPRTTDDLRLMLIREYDQADGFGLMADSLGLNAEHDAAMKAADAADENFSARAWWVARFAAMTADQLGALVVGIALEDVLGTGRIYTHHDGARERAAARVALAERYGVDVLAAARPEQMDDAGVAGGTATAGAQIDAFAGAEA